MKTFAIIPSGGTGKRLGENIPKQYLKVKGKELIAYTLEVFQNSQYIDEIIVASQPEYFELINDIKAKFNISKLTKIVEGGTERQDSVYNALSSLTANANDLIAVHDAARPLLPVNILNSSLISAKQKGNSVVALKARDTLVNTSEDVLGYLDRSNILYIQTPQIFSYSVLMQAMKQAYDENFKGTDESIIVSRAGHKIYFYEGVFQNFKITTKSDFDLFSSLCD